MWQHHLDQLQKRYCASTNTEIEETSSDDVLPELSDSLIDVDVIPSDATNQSYQETASDSTSTLDSTSSIPASHWNPPRIRKPLIT